MPSKAAQFKASSFEACLGATKQPQNAVLTLNDNSHHSIVHNNDYSNDILMKINGPRDMDRKNSFDLVNLHNSASSKKNMNGGAADYYGHQHASEAANVVPTVSAFKL